MVNWFDGDVGGDNDDDADDDDDGDDDDGDDDVDDDDDDDSDDDNYAEGGEGPPSEEINLNWLEEVKNQSRRGSHRIWDEKETKLSLKTDDNSLMYEYVWQ